MNTVMMRALLYTVLGLGAAAGSWLADAPDDPTWKQWAILGVSMVIGGGNALRAYIDGSAERAKRGGASPSNQPNLFQVVALGSLGASVVLLSGCARFSTNQKEVRSGETTTITTKATATTFFAGKSALAAWEAKQTDGEQSASVGGLEQEANATGLATNVVDAVVRAAISAAARAP